MHHLVVPPDSSLHDLLGCIWNEVDFDFFIELDFWDLDGVAEERNPPIAVDGSGLTQAKDVLGRRVGFREGEGAEEAMALFLGSVEANAGDLFGGGVDLLVVIAMYFFPEDLPNILYG